MRTIEEIIEDLKKPIPDKLIKTRNQGGREIPYIEWHTATRILDHFAPGWQSEVRNIAQVGNMCVVTVRIGIPTSDGMVWREDVGQESLATDSYGDPATNAHAMALKRCAAKFGVGLHLYTEKAQQQNGYQHPRAVPSQTFSDDAPVCTCGEPAKLIQGTSKTSGKPYAMWVCSKDRNSQCDFKMWDSDWNPGAAKAQAA